MKILNLYAGIGGNRKLWGDEHDITAVEINPDIAKIYHDFFPNDTMIVGDAHQYLLDHIQDDWDFIWSSPPCPSHSQVRRNHVISGQNVPVYPDMNLYQEVILLNTHLGVNCKYIVENVEPYYKPLISAQKVSRHLIWSNFYIRPFTNSANKVIRDIDGVNPEPVYGFDLRRYDIEKKRQLLRNCVNPYLGLHILKCSQDDSLNMNLFDKGATA